MDGSWIKQQLVLRKKITIWKFLMQRKKIYSYSVVYANIKHTFIQIRKKKKKPILWHYYYENLSDFLRVIIVFYIWNTIQGYYLYLNGFFLNTFRLFEVTFKKNTQKMSKYKTSLVLMNRESDRSDQKPRSWFVHT